MKNKTAACNVTSPEIVTIYISHHSVSEIWW